MILSTPQVTGFDLEKSLQESLNAFVKLFFTGTPVALAGETVTLPVCDIYFQQTQVDQPTTKPQIHFTFSNLSSTGHQEGNTRLVRSPVQITTYVRTSPTGKGNEADYQCRRVANALKVVFETERQTLGQKGIRNILVPRGPIALQTPGIQTRMMVITGTLEYRLPQ